MLLVVLPRCSLAYLIDPDWTRGHKFVVCYELTGDPGDVVLTHPWMLHHVAPNTSSYPRMMRGKTYNRCR